MNKGERGIRILAPSPYKIKEEQEKIDPVTNEPVLDRDGMPVMEEVEIKIPAGVGEGMQLSVSGKGNAARRGGINGDLLVVIEEERDPQLVRDGNDLLHSHKISIPTAVLGGTIEVPTVEGRAKVKVAAGTKAGSVLRLRGKGIPDINGRGRGDILVVVDIDVPSKLSVEERKTVEQLAQSPSFGTPDNSRPEQNIFERMRNFFR